MKYHLFDVYIWRNLYDQLSEQLYYTIRFGAKDNVELFKMIKDKTLYQQLWFIE